MGLSVPFSRGLTLADLHILYVTKQNKNHYHQTRFAGLKTVAKYNTFVAWAPLWTPLGELRPTALPRSLSCTGEEGRRGREDRKEEERGQGRGEEGRAGEEKRGERRRGRNAPTFWSSLRP